MKGSGAPSRGSGEQKASGKATMTSGINAMNMRTDWNEGLRGRLQDSAEEVGGRRTGYGRKTPGEEFKETTQH